VLPKSAKRASHLCGEAGMTKVFCFYCEILHFIRSRKVFMFPGILETAQKLTEAYYSQLKKAQWSKGDLRSCLKICIETIEVGSSFIVGRILVCGWWHELDLNLFHQVIYKERFTYVRQEEFFITSHFL